MHAQCVQRNIAHINATVFSHLLVLTWTGSYVSARDLGQSAQPLIVFSLCSLSDETKVGLR